MPRTGLLLMCSKAARGIACLLVPVLVLLAAGVPARAQGPSPAYFAPGFTLLGVAPRAASTEARQGITRATHVGADGKLRVVVDHTACVLEQCLGIMRAGADYLNGMATRNAGWFVAVTETEIQAEWRVDGALVRSLIQLFPDAMLVWTITDARSAPTPMEPFLSFLEQAADRWRAELLAAVPDAALMPWAERLHARARALLAAGEKDDALALLRRLASAAPRRYAVLADLAETETAPEAARAAARVVLEQAEDGTLRRRAAAVLGISLPGLEALPVLTPDADGLRLVLIALPPCDAGLLADAARIYERITDIPTRIVRLDGAWQWGPEDRFLGQPLVLEELRKTRRLGGDAVSWDRARTIAALRAVPAGMDAMGRYAMERSVAAVAEAPAQYDAGPVLGQLARRIADARAADPRVMYVAVTETAIHTADTVFAFSAVSPGAKPVGILSYAIMLGRAVEGGEPSRSRLAERLAKEMVPASLAQLGIPRPVDMTDPYSEANSVGRLAAKTLTLSAATRAAVEAARAGSLPSR